MYPGGYQPNYNQNTNYRPRPDFNSEGKPVFWNQRHPVPNYNNYMVENNGGGMYIYVLVM